MHLRATLDDLDVLVAASKPATKDLAPFLRELRPLLARRAADDPRPAHARHAGPGPDNDLLEATRKFPQLQHVGDARLPQRDEALQKPQPVLEFARPYAPELVGWFRDFGQGAANYDANGHFARVQPIFNAFRFDRQPGRRPALRRSRRPSASTAARPASCAAAPAPRPSPPPTAPRRGRDASGRSTATRRQVPPGP